MTYWIFINLIGCASARKIQIIVKKFGYHIYILHTIWTIESIIVKLNKKFKLCYNL